MKTVKHLSVLLAVLLVVSLLVVGFVVNADDPTTITVTNEAEFADAMLAANKNANIVLANDIALTNGNITMDDTYTGIFDGAGYTVSGITNTLFKVLDGATVKNVTFEGTIVSENRKAATVAYDTANNVWFEDITSYVDITCNASNPNAGGIIGYGKTVTCTNVTYAGDYIANSSSDTEVGGIAGYTRHNGGSGTSTYTNCAFTGTITVNNETTGHIYAGAILGNGREGTNNLVNCLSTGTITINAAEALTDVVASGTAGNNNASTYTITNCVNLTTFVGIEGVDGIAKGNAATTNGLFNATHAAGDPVEVAGVAYQAYTNGDATVYVGANKVVAELPKEPGAPEEVPSFSEGTIAKGEDGKYTIDTDDFAAFISARGASATTADYRFVIAADIEKFMACEDLTLALVFVKGEEVVATAEKNIREELKMYASATAAGNTYVAADGVLITGIVVKGIPADGWDAVAVGLVDGEENVVAAGAVAAADVELDADSPDYTEAVDFETAFANECRVLGFESHGEHGENAVFALRTVGDAAAWAALTAGTTASGTLYETPDLEWSITINGKEYPITGLSIYYGGETGGWFRIGIGPMSAFQVEADPATGCEVYNIELTVKVKGTNKVAYYYSPEVVIQTTMISDPARPAGITAVATDDLTVKEGPDMDGDEGTDKAFDGNIKTKLCNGEETSTIIVEFSAVKNLFGISLVNANDNEDDNDRTVTAFDVYVSEDGETWGDAIFTTTGEGVDKAEISQNFLERYYGFEEAASAKYVKLVINNGGLYQFSEVVFYEAAPQNVELPLTGLKELTVDTESLSYEGINVWNAEKESVKQLFDGDTSNTKMGGGVQKVEGTEDLLPVTINFSLTEAAKVSYYTIYTGNDTEGGNVVRNPLTWTLYGKVGEEWVAISTVDNADLNGLEGYRSAPYSYATNADVECKDYKLVLVTNGSMQLNELVLYKNDESATGAVAAALFNGAHVVLIHRNDYLKAPQTEEEYQFSLTIKADGNFFNNNTISTIADKPMWVYIKDATNGGNYVRYEIEKSYVQAHAYISFTAKDFTPVEGVEYDILLFVTAGEGDGLKYPNAVHVIPSWGFKLGEPAKGFPIY